VLKVLTTQYNVAASRLQAYGDGPYAPVASNDSDDDEREIAASNW